MHWRCTRWCQRPFTKSPKQSIEPGINLPGKLIRNTRYDVAIRDHPTSLARLLVDFILSKDCFACRLGFDGLESYEQI
jgi:hypothetical protein